MVRGQGAYLFDQEGKAYLDCVNNVAHVGHSNSEVRVLSNPLGQSTPNFCDQGCICLLLCCDIVRRTAV